MQNMKMLEEQEILTEDNYFSHKMQNEYLSTSQIKDCVGVPAQIGCELRWYATIRGGYKPKTSLREGLRKFAEWYYKFYIKHD